MGGVRAVRRSVVPLLAVLCCAAPAQAETRAWQAPHHLAAMEVGVNDYQLVSTAAGETVVAWIEQNHESIRAMAAAVRADGTLQGPVMLAESVGGCVLDIAADAAGNVIVALSHPNGQLDVHRRPAGGEWQAPETVSPAWTDYGYPRVAMSSTGDAAVLWRAWDSGTQLIRTRISVSRDAGPWSAPVTLGTDGEFGGHDVAMTPDGSAVAVWLVEDTISSVKAATLRPDGTASAVQTLRASTSIKTCPQVEANALGQVAALWHEIEQTYCGNWGADVLALRPAGATQFQAPQTVPGAQSDVARGTLALADNGRLTVSYDGANGGQIVSGTSGGPLAVTPLESYPIALGSDPEGADVIAVSSLDGQGIDTRDHPAPGQIQGRQPLSPGGGSGYMRLDEGAGRAGALFDAYGEGGGLKVAVDAPDPNAPAPTDEPTSEEDEEDTTSTTPTRPPTSAPTTPPQSPPTQPAGVAAAAREAGDVVPFAARVLAARFRPRAVLLDVDCTQRCTVSARLTLTGRRGSAVRVATPARSLERSGTLRVRLTRAQARRLGRGPVRILARLSATGPAGERSETVLRRR